MGSRAWNVDGRHPPSKTPVGVQPPEWRETTEQTDWRAKQPSQVACFSEDLKCWGAREGHRQSQEHWNCLKGNDGEISERRGGAKIGFFDRIDTIVNWSELSWCTVYIDCSSPQEGETDFVCDLMTSVSPWCEFVVDWALNTSNRSADAHLCGKCPEERTWAALGILIFLLRHTF